MWLIIYHGHALQYTRPTMKYLICNDLTCENDILLIDLLGKISPASFTTTKSRNEL